MQFTSDNAQKVIAAKKTQTRRPVQDGDKLEWAGVPGDSPPVVFSLKNDICYRAKWQIGKTYAVQPGRGKPAIGRIQITAIRKERVQDISEEDAKAEGAPVLGAFLRDGTNSNVNVCHLYGFIKLWDSINGKRPGLRWVDNPEVWVLEFKPVANAGGQALPKGRSGPERPAAGYTIMEARTK